MMLNRFAYQFKRMDLSAKLFFVFVMIVVFEGGLRKWAGLPTSLFVALRDIIAIVIVLSTALYGRYRAMRNLSFLIAGWTVALVIFSVIQTIINETPPVILLVGWRFWLLYLWLSLAVACTLTKEDLFLIARTLIFILIFIMLPLTLVQSILPSSHYINTQPDTDIENIFKLAGDTVRATGTFSFTLGLTCFLGLLIPFAFSGKFMQKNLYSSKIMYSIGLLAVSMLAIFSGSRAAIIWIGIMYIIFSLSEYIINHSYASAKRIAGMVFFAIIFGLVVYIFFQENLASYRERFYVASKSEDIIERFLVILFGEPHVLPSFTLLGEGLGLGSNAGGDIMTGGDKGFLLAESEPGRNLLEAGAMGMVWIIIKYITGAYALIWSLYSLKKTKDILPLLLTITSLYAFITWPVSGQLSAHAISYILLSFLFFYMRVYKFNVKVTF